MGTDTPAPRAPLLILACGNPARGDDALGPRLIERLEERPELAAGADLLWDFQLQIEHALDIAGRDRVLFVDAAAAGPEPYAVLPVSPQPAIGASTHALSPGAVLEVLTWVTDDPPPDCRLLAIRGHNFALGAPLTRAASRHLEAALAWVAGWVREDPRVTAPPWGEHGRDLEG